MKLDLVSEQMSLREIVGDAHPAAKDKEMDRLDKHGRHFISLSPFLCLGTMSADGKADVSPRGDPPGFVQVPDDKTLLIPDRKGNRRIDSMTNILENPSVGVIFFLPGVEETLRVNGKASVINDPETLAKMEVNKHVPTVAIRIDIETVFFHCAKALKRSRLWDPDARIDRDQFPRYGEIWRDQRMQDANAHELEAFIQQNYKEELY